MAIPIIDGTGKGFQAKVDATNRLAVKAEFNSEFDVAIQEDGQGYTLSSTYTTGGSDDEVIYLKNTSATLNLHIDTVECTAATAALWTYLRVTSGTAGGTTITPLNMDDRSSNAAAATAFGNNAVTGSLTGDIISVKLGAANSDVVFTNEGVMILGQNDEIAVTYATTSTVVAVTIYFHFQSK